MPKNPAKNFIQKKMLKSFDDTQIAYYTIGKGKKTIVLNNGLGGTYIAWKPLYDAFCDRYRILIWDYRGLFGSEAPADEKAVSMEDHLRDLEAILKKEKIKKTVIGGWSMGVQVSLEFYRQHPEYYEGMILINGTSGYPFKTALNNPLSQFILPVINELAQKIAPAIQPTIKPIANRLIDWKGFVQIISKLGLAHENLDPKIFKEVAREIIKIDLHIYHEIMRHLSEHDASDMLSTIKVPVLIFAGEDDMMTPLKTAEKMSQAITDSQFFVIPKGSHYSLLEFPDLINLRIEQFLKEYY